MKSLGDKCSSQETALAIPTFSGAKLTFAFMGEKSLYLILGDSLNKHKTETE